MTTNTIPIQGIEKLGNKILKQLDYENPEISVIALSMAIPAFFLSLCEGDTEKAIEGIGILFKDSINHARGFE